MIFESSKMATMENPMMLYGTAWKKEKSAILVKEALGAGFRAVDVAAQPKHYREELVGKGIRVFLQEQHLKREELYVRFSKTKPSFSGSGF